MSFLLTCLPRTVSGFTRNELQSYIEVSEWFPEIPPALSMIQPGGWSVSCWSRSWRIRQSSARVHIAWWLQSSLLCSHYTMYKLLMVSFHSFLAV